MKRVPWLVVFLAALAIAALVFLREPGPQPSDLERMSRRIPAPTLPPLPPVDLPPPPLPPMAAPEPRMPTLPPLPRPGVEIAIEDGKSIDFSSGLPFMTETAKEKAIMEKARQEMEAAAAGISFGPPTSAPGK